MLREVNLEIDRVFMEEFPDDYDRRLTSVQLRNPQPHPGRPKV